MEVATDLSFREDAYYKKVLCPRFQSYIKETQPNKPPNNPDDAFIAIDVIDKKYRDGRVCKFIEVPGEHLFEVDRTANEQSLPTYINEIFHAKAKKIILFLAPFPCTEVDEHGALTDHEFREYCLHIERIIDGQLNVRKDDFIFIVTKADQQREKLIASNAPNKSAFRKTLLTRDGFGRVEAVIRRANRRLIVVPFSAGTIGKAQPGRPDTLTYGDDAWPEMLWNEIRGSIYGDGLLKSIKSLFGID